MMNRHWVATRYEASGANEATPTVAEASEASGIYLLIEEKLSFHTVWGRLPNIQNIYCVTKGTLINTLWTNDSWCQRGPSITYIVLGTFNP